MRSRLAILMLLLAATLAAQTPTPIDPSDAIISATGIAGAATAANGQGQFVVAWQESGIKARRYDADGTPTGSVLSVNATGTDPAVALAESGAFLVVWRDGNLNIKKRFYAANDAPTAAADVDADLDGLRMGDVAADAAGNFVVAWAENTGSYDYDVKARRYDSAGANPGAEQAVTSGTAKDRDPRIAYSAGADGYIVVWDREVSDYDIRGRLLDANGIPSSPDFAVNSYLTGVQVRADVARSREGSFFVVWDGPGSGDAAGIFGRPFDAAGNPTTAQVAVNTFTTNSQQRPRVAMDASANYVVTWSSDGSVGNDNSANSVQGRAFLADGSGLGSQFQINAYTTQEQLAPDVAMLGGGDFVIAWHKNANASLDVRMRRFASDLPLFADGFASGNELAWSATVP